MNTLYNTNDEQEYTKTVEKIRGFSQHVRPEARHLHAILEKIPARKKAVPSPFLSMVWKMVPVGTAFALLIGLASYVTFSGKRDTVEVATLSSPTVPSTRAEVFTKLEEAFTANAANESAVASDESALSYAEGESEDITTIGNAYTYDTNE